MASRCRPGDRGGPVLAPPRLHGRGPPASGTPAGHRHPSRGGGPGHPGLAVLQASTLACFGGDYPATTGHARQGLELCTMLDDLPGQAWAHRWLGEAAMALGDLAAAEPHFQRQLALAEQARDSWTQAAAWSMLAQVSRYQGRYQDATAQLRRAQRARDLFRPALRGHQQTGSKRGMAYDLEGLATVAAMTGDGPAALTYLGAAQALREQSGGPLMPVDQAILDKFLDPGVAALTRQEREQALAEGRNRPLTQIIDEAVTG